ncbi:MAG: hypothetical protein AAF389_17090 [Gemmatimonadota bacterium]
MIVSATQHLRRRTLGAALLLTTIGLGFPPAVAGQEPMELRLEENFRREPNGVILARLSAGSMLRVLTTEGNWTQVELEGWVWLPSVAPSDEPGMDLVISESGGENLRAAPSGSILARLEEGALLEELSRDANWVRVTRVGWVWSESLGGVSGTPNPVVPSAAPSTSGPAARAPGGVRTVGEVGGPILAAPDGDTLAVAAPSSDVVVVRREGGWARVRLEGWMWLPEAEAAEGEGPTPVAVEAEAVEPDALQADPELYAGRVVEWTLQFISLERAEAVRTDFFEGEPFLLARFGGADGPFVYVAVPVDRLSEVEGLVPLESVAITGRVRTGASALTGAPIVDLLTLDRSPR